MQKYKERKEAPGIAYSCLYLFDRHSGDENIDFGNNMGFLAYRQ